MFYCIPVKIYVNEWVIFWPLPFIPLKKVENNLWPDRLEGQRTLIPNHCRQSTLLLPNLWLEVLTVHSNESMSVLDPGISLFILWAENWSQHLSYAERLRYVLRHSRRSQYIPLPQSKSASSLWNYTASTLKKENTLRNVIEISLVT